MRLLREGYYQHLEVGRSEATAEGEGFEPPGLSPDRFQDGHHKPLGHPSRCTLYSDVKGQAQNVILPTTADSRRRKGSMSMRRIRSCTYKRLRVRWFDVKVSAPGLANRPALDLAVPQH